MDIDQELGVTEDCLRQSLKLAEAHVEKLTLLLEQRDARIKALEDEIADLKYDAEWNRMHSS